MTITSYKQAVKYLESFIGKIIFKVDKEFLKEHDPLERMRVLLGLLGNPQEKFKSILVGGTSGKGSTAYLVSHILITAGYKTGLTISPHLQKINERIQINGKEISDKKFVELINLVIPAIEKMSFDSAQDKLGAPSYFEILIAMTFLYFVQQQVDIAVVEVGMGGEYDATNTLNPLIAVLTNVGLDHTNVLGKTVEKIARTKSGIIKPGVLSEVIPPASAPSVLSVRAVGSPSSSATPLVIITGVKQPTVIKIVEERCERVGAKLFRLGKDFHYKIKKEDHEGSVFDLTIDNDRVSQLNDLSISLLGDYQVKNASLAVEAVLNLKKFGFEVKENVIRKALRTAFFPGRFEIVQIARQPRVSDDAQLHISKKQTLTSASLSKSQLQSKPKPTFNSSESGLSRSLVLDGAHNPTKMKEFLNSLKKLFPKERKLFIIGFKFDKDIPKMLKQIIKVADEIIVTEFNRATDMSISASAGAESIKYQVLSIKYRGKITVEKDSKKALQKALNILISKYPNIPSVIVVTGSLYLVGEVRSML